MPLLDLETEVFLESGAWKSIDDLEDCLTLEELSVLYDKTHERQSRLIEVIGGAMGLEFDRGGGREVSSDNPKLMPRDIKDINDVASMPINLGYENN